jgi:hypothetical protein
MLLETDMEPRTALFWAAQHRAKMGLEFSGFGGDARRVMCTTVAQRVNNRCTTCEQSRAENSFEIFLREGVDAGGARPEEAFWER